MVKIMIDIEAVAGDPQAMTILLKTNGDQAVEAEEAAAKRLLPGLRNLLKALFPEDDELRQQAA